jgi:hypothetical protein
MPCCANQEETQWNEKLVRYQNQEAMQQETYNTPLTCQHVSAAVGQSDGSCPAVHNVMCAKLLRHNAWGVVFDDPALEHDGMSHPVSSRLNSGLLLEETNRCECASFEWSQVKAAMLWAADQKLPVLITHHALHQPASTGTKQ